MRVLGISLLFVAAAFSGCAARMAVPYPATPAGEALRRCYTAPAKDFPDAAAALSQIQDPQTRQSLEPAMLAIIGRDDSTRAVVIGSLLADWEPMLPSTAGEFGHLLPALARGLRRGNRAGAAADIDHLPAVSSALLLGRMGPAAAYPIRGEMYACFNAPVDKPIAGESDDAWTRAILGVMISCYGQDGVPVLVKGLEHPDAWVRQCALGGLSDTAELGGPQGFWQVRDSDLAVNTAAARAALPRVIERLWDADAGVRSHAAQAVGILAAPQTLPPRARDRLWEMFLSPDRTLADPQRVGAALAALHPVFTAQLLEVFDNPRDPHQRAAAVALQAIGGAIVPEMVARLGRDASFAAPDGPEAVPAYWAHAVIKGMGTHALAGLKEAAENTGDAVARQRAQACLDEIVKAARATVDDRVSALENPRPTMNDEIVQQDIRDLQANAAVAASALPVLDTLARVHASPQVRQAAEAAAEQIRREKIDLP